MDCLKAVGAAITATALGLGPSVYLLTRERAPQPRTIDDITYLLTAPQEINPSDEAITTPIFVDPNGFQWEVSVDHHRDSRDNSIIPGGFSITFAPTGLTNEIRNIHKKSRASSEIQSLWFHPGQPLTLTTADPETPPTTYDTAPIHKPVLYTELMTAELAEGLPPETVVILRINHGLIFQGINVQPRHTVSIPFGGKETVYEDQTMDYAALLIGPANIFKKLLLEDAPLTDDDQWTVQDWIAVTEKSPFIENGGKIIYAAFPRIDKSDITTFYKDRELDGPVTIGSILPPKKK